MAVLYAHFFAEKWICYMPMILDFMERLEVHDLLKIGYITCPFFYNLWKPYMPIKSENMDL